MTAIVEKLRAQCRIDTDDATDDELLMLYFQAACRKAENFINRKLYEDTVPEDDPEGLLIVDDILLALMLLVGHWYENRENSSDASKTTIPFGFSSLLEPYRFIPL
ncbi:phage gp6-like head-tail connector protein [Salmonella enterica subsp. salamae serovar 13,22:z:-]|uniref:head-tail connector protein n=1 Tax=Salmonella enterica TaxID=28901 RepID=UPI001033ACA5|nr:head-tail connector protein [Salmonella enterica]TBN95996.1 phage gp6-like head-tail connector protein [Salmonella enterica subsp. salamae serovar 13,22:z:-]